MRKLILFVVAVVFTACKDKTKESVKAEGDI